MLDEGVAFPVNDVAVVHFAKATVIKRDALLFCTGTLHLKETFDGRHHLTSIYQLDGETVQLAQPVPVSGRAAAQPVPLAPAVQAAAIAAYQAAAALKTDYVKLHDRLTKDKVATGSPVAADLVAALKELLARAASSHIGYPEVTISIKADLTALKVTMPPAKPNEDYWVDTHDDQIGKTLTFVDAKTGITFYVEADARHVVAMSPTGTVLWRRDPFVDAHLPYNGVATPVIWSVGLDYLGRVFLALTSNESGHIDPATGDFTFDGSE
jgi:hypothetical protein